MAKALEPWQSGATELIEKAIDHLHQGTDRDRRVAFLLLDVGVETLFKTFLLLPVKVTKTKLSFAERTKAAEGNHHELVEGIDKAAADRLEGIDLARVQFYHDVRNKLYHEGSGITISARQAQEYSRLAVGLFKALLEVDLSRELNKPTIEAKRQKRAEAKLAQEQQEINARTQEVQEARKKVERLARLAIEKVHPALALPSFEQKYDGIVHASKPVDVVGREIIELLTAITHDTSWREFADPRWWGGEGLNSFYLIVLQAKIQPQDREPWPGMYELSSWYPKEIPTDDRFVYDDANAPGKYLAISHTREDVLNQGEEWARALSRIARAIEEWMKTQA